MKPEVYFKPVLDSNQRRDCLVEVLDSLQSWFKTLKQGEIVGIKTTIGDSKNRGHIKPELIKLVVDKLNALEVKSFCFDTNVIYKGMRMNAVDHMNLAYSKGFSPEHLGCPFIIADGVFGTDSRVMKVNLKNLKEIRVPSLIMVLENLIVLSHITGHMLTGYAASIKNVGMGMASRAGKQIQHSSVKPSIIKDKCTLCGCCIDICPVGAISKKQDKAFIDSSVCIGCGECIGACKFDAVQINWEEDANIFIERTTEYARGILSQIKRKIFLNFAFDITKECDCLAGDDPKIVEDAGIFASDDILAVDKACFDVLAGKGDVFAKHQNTRVHLHQFSYAQEIGLGSLDYELIRL
jgi:uncharacterized Fe-S center protein